jgi:acyl-CoA dehydrogenase
MDFELASEHRMLKDLVERVVADELIPLEPKVVRRDAEGQEAGFTSEQRKRLDQVSNEMGLHGLDAPKDLGGFDLPMVALVGVEEALGRTVASTRHIRARKLSPGGSPMS